MKVGVNAIERKRDFVTLKFQQNAAVDPEQLARFVSAQRGAQFTPDGMLKFVLKATAAEEVLRALRTVLEQLASAESASEVRSASGPTQFRNPAFVVFQVLRARRFAALEERGFERAQLQPRPNVPRWIAALAPEAAIPQYR